MEITMFVKGVSGEELG